LAQGRKGRRVRSDNLPLSGPLAAQSNELDAQYRRYWQPIRRYIVRRFGNGPPDPDDAVQAAFERFARLEDRSAIIDPGAFLRRSAHNFVLDHHRAEKVRAHHARGAAHLESGTDEIDPERVLSARERLMIIEQAIRAMDEKRRDVLIMSRIQGHSSAEIARRLGCSPTLVKMRLAEALVLCERALRAAEDER
jgi:RNA polymerase sigma factor (sigma-70 family)